MNLPLIGISAGDPAGIGAEVTVKAISEPEIRAICRPLVIGDADVLAKAVEACGLDLKVQPVKSVNEAKFEPGTVDVFDLGCLAATDHHYRQATPEQGRAAYEYIAKNIALALAGEIDATVTAPINKEALNKAGCHHAGHTEIYATLTGTKDYCMMLAEGNFRVAHVSTHVALRDACDAVKQERVLKVIELADQALRKMGIEKPRIGVAGLNPHSGENGLFGREEIEEIIPAIEAARSTGIDATGPVPPDTVFTKMAGGAFDLVVVMYHDQGHIPIKMKGFKFDERTGQMGAVAGVNVTLGLPIVRVSVDHGTAFEIAGEGRANPESMIDSIKLAASLAAK